MTEPAQAVTGWKGGWYVVPYRVMFRDVDAFGHVNNAVYLTLFEMARTHLWFDIAGGSLPTDISFIVARAEIDFREQIGMEPVSVCVRVGEMRTTSFDTHYEIRKDNGGQIAATGKVVVVLFDWEKQAKMPISADIRKRVQSLQMEDRHDA